MKPTTDPALNPVRILIVDDVPDNRALLDIVFVREGYVVEAADNGEAALAAVAVRQPDLILLDVMMPGMSGYEVAARLKADVATKGIPILMLSGLSDRAASTNALNAGADAFLARPVERVALVVRVRELLLMNAACDKPSLERAPPPVPSGNAIREPIKPPTDSCSRPVWPGRCKPLH